MRSSYRTEDVTLLLKDITGMIAPKITKTREEKIQAGVHYCEMLPKEYVPNAKSMGKFTKKCLNLYANEVGKSCLLPFRGHLCQSAKSSIGIPCT